MSRFSWTVIPGNTPRPSGACTMPSMTRLNARILVMSWPSKTMDPWDSGLIPEIARMVVVLPAPLAPIRVTSSPSSTDNEMPCSASIRPYATFMSLISSRGIVGHPQVGGDNRGVVADLGRQTFGDLLAELQYHDPVGHPHHQPHVVLDQQHRVPVRPDLADQILQRGLLGRVEPGGRLVQAQQFRFGGQRPGDLQPALVAVGQIPGLLGGAGADAHEFQQGQPSVDRVALLMPVPRH